MEITKEMTIREALMLNPKTAEVFLQYGMHCLGCPATSGEKIEEAAMAHGIDVEALIRDLNKAVKE